ncbi:MAG TPA: hypothetical protein VGC57_02590 [Cellulomonas sp.]
MRRITAVDLSLPPSWLSWQPGGGTAEARRVADEIGACALALTRSRQVVLDTDRSLSVGLTYPCVAAWAPPADEPEVLGTLVAEVLAGTGRDTDPARRHLTRLRHLVRRSTRTGNNRVRYHEARLDTLGGSPAVLARRTVPAGVQVGVPGPAPTLLAGGRTREELVCTLFVLGVADGVELRLTAEDDAGLTRLVEQADVLAAGVQVRLGGEVELGPRRGSRRPSERTGRPGRGDEEEAGAARAQGAGRARGRGRGTSGPGAAGA